VKNLIRSILRDKRFRYLATGGTSFVAEYGSFLALVYGVAASAWLSQAGSYCIGLVVNFVLLRYWAFTSAKSDKVGAHVSKYLVLVAFNLPITSLFMAVMTSHGLKPFIAKIVVVAAAALWNYVIYDKIIFKQRFAPEDAL
jgi:putative flippase GtrA